MDKGRFVFILNQRIETKRQKNQRFVCFIMELPPYRQSTGSSDAFVLGEYYFFNAVEIKI